MAIFLGIILLSASVLVAKSCRVADIKAFKKCVKQLESGDEVILKDGIWQDVDLTLRGRGRADAPIVMRAENRGGVIISGFSSLRMVGDFLQVDGLIFKHGVPSKRALITIGSRHTSSTHCRVKNVTVEGFNDADESRRVDWVVIVGGEYNRVDHCQFIHMKNRGVTLKVVLTDPEPNHHLIDHNLFAFRKKGEVNGYETIRIGTSNVSTYMSATTVRENYFYHCDGEIEIISNKSCGNSYIHNTFKNCNGMLTLRHGNDCLVKDNFFFNTDNSYMGGVRVIGEGHKIINNYFYKVGVSPLRAAVSLINSRRNAPIYDYLPVRNILIAHNKFIETAYAIFSGANYKKGRYPIVPEAVMVRNNLFVNSQKPFLWQGKKLKLVFEKNIVYNATDKKVQPWGYRTDPRLYLEKGIWRSHIPELFHEKYIFPLKKKLVGPDYGID